MFTRNEFLKLLQSLGTCVISEYCAWDDPYITTVDIQTESGWLDAFDEHVKHGMAV